MKHFMKLAIEPYTLIKQGAKVIESRLFDEKRSQLQLGDVIVFSCNEDPADTTDTRVTGLLRYEKFEDLFNDHEASMFGGTSTLQLINQIKEFYSDEEISKFGVIGIRLGNID